MKITWKGNIEIVLALAIFVAVFIFRDHLTFFEGAAIVGCTVLMVIMLYVSIGFRSFLEHKKEERQKKIQEADESRILAQNAADKAARDALVVKQEAEKANKV